jgi:hypothetical protein
MLIIYWGRMYQRKTARPKFVVVTCPQPSHYYMAHISSYLGTGAPANTTSQYQCHCLFSLSILPFELERLSDQPINRPLPRTTKLLQIYNRYFDLPTKKSRFYMYDSDCSTWFRSRGVVLDLPLVSGDTLLTTT